jgi:predicted ester cyclase
MTAPDPGPGTAGRAPAAVTTYRAFLAAVNDQDLEAAAALVDPARYRENCVGFTRGFVGWEDAKTSVRQVWQGLPDLHVDLTAVSGDDEVALAHGTVTGTNTGRLYGAPGLRPGGPRRAAVAVGGLSPVTARPAPRSGAAARPGRPSTGRRAPPSPA